MSSPLIKKMTDAVEILRACIGLHGMWADSTRYRHQYWTRDFVLAALPAFLEPDLLNTGNYNIPRDHLENLSKRQRDNGQIPILFLDHTMQFLWEKIKKSFRDRTPSFMLKRFLQGELWNLTPGTRDSEILYIIGMYEYARKTDDRELLVMNMHRTHKAMRYVESHLIKNGLIHGCDWRDTMEKELGDTPLLTNNVLLYHAYILMNQHKKARALLDQINRVFWKNGSYLDYPESERFDPLGGALAVLYDVVPPERYASIVRSFKSVDTARGVTIKCKHNPISPEERTVIDETDGVVIWPFVAGFTILALLKMKEYDMARDQLTKLCKLDGFREWYDPRTGKGYGADQQMWSAALLLRAGAQYVATFPDMRWKGENGICMDTRSLLLNGSYELALKTHGQGEVRHEISDMMYHDLAYEALKAAHALRYTDLARTAATVIKNSGSYGQDARTLAQTYIS